MALCIGNMRGPEDHVISISAQYRIPRDLQDPQVGCIGEEPSPDPPQLVISQVSVTHREVVLITTLGIAMQYLLMTMFISGLILLQTHFHKISIFF